MSEQTPIEHMTRYVARKIRRDTKVVIRTLRSESQELERMALRLEAWETETKDDTITKLRFPSVDSDRINVRSLVREINTLEKEIEKLRCLQEVQGEIDDNDDPHGGSTCERHAPTSK